MKAFYANKFYFIVSDTDEKNAKDLYQFVERCCDQQNLSSALKLSTKYLPVNSKEEFNQAISLIEKEAGNGIMPYIHIETHGYKGGIELKSGAQITWQELLYGFTKINITCRNNLFVSIASCWAGTFTDVLSKKLNKLHEARSPVYGFIGPTNDIPIGNLESFTNYFNILLREKDFTKAYDYLINDTKDSSCFTGELTETLYQNLINIYIEHIVVPKFESSRAYIAYLNEMLKDFFQINGRTIKPKELEELHKIIISQKHYIEVLNKIGEHFFMIDLYKENAYQFSKIEKITNWDKMVEHLK
jgi:hypothetical protein